MNRIFACTLGVLALTIAAISYQTAPADASTITPGNPTYVSPFGGCSGWVTIAQYGGTAIGQFHEEAGSTCHPNTWVQVSAFRNGGFGVKGPQCTLWGRLSNPYGSGCVYNGTYTQSLVQGNVVGVDLWRCYGPNPYSPAGCMLSQFSIWG